MLKNIKEIFYKGLTKNKQNRVKNKIFIKF